MLRGAQQRIARARADSGFTLVETLVAMVIFAVMVPASLTVLTKTVAGTAENRSRVVAASVAESAIEAARGQSASTVSSGSSTKTVGNVVYTVAQTVTASTATGAATDCTSITPAVNYALVTVKVTWPDMGTIQPVRSDTLLRATAGGTGAIAVSVTGSSGQVVSGIPVTLSNGAVVTTNANGCAVFANLAPGSYTASLNSVGYVGTNGVQTVTSPAATVVANEVTKVAMIYDLAMSLAITYTNPTGGALTAAQLAEIPPDFRTGVVTNSAKTTSVTLPGAAPLLYPSIYTLKSGASNACTLGIRDMSSGSPSTQTLSVPTATVGISNFTTIASIGAINATYEGPTTGSGNVSCPVGTTVNVGYVFSIFGDHSVQLPLGRWQLQFPWNPLGFIPIPGLTTICSNISLDISSPATFFIDVGNLVSAILAGLVTGGGC